MTKWVDHWNITFPPRLSDKDVVAFEEIIRAKLPDVTSDEIKAAIDILAESGSYDSFGSKPHQLRTQIKRMREASKGNVRTLESAIRLRVMREKDPSKRWDICCEQTPSTDPQMTERLIKFCEGLPGGIKEPDMTIFKAAFKKLCRKWDCK